MRAWMFCALVAGCDSFPFFDKGDTSQDSGEADADADADTDADGDTDADTDTDVDTDTSWCDDALSTAAPEGPDCISDVVTCGDVVTATNEGGGSDFDAENWEGWYCTPNLDRHDYDGPERTYQIFIPADTTATFDFATPCTDLDLFVFYWQTEDTCPVADNSIRECETVDDTGNGGSVSVWSDVGAYYLVAIDGRDADVGNFRFEVSCAE